MEGLCWNALPHTRCKGLIFFRSLIAYGSWYTVTYENGEQIFLAELRLSVRVYAMFSELQRNYMRIRIDWLVDSGEEFTQTLSSASDISS